MPVMTEPMIWGNWPLVAESSNDSSLMPDSFPTHGLADNQTGMDEGEDGSKRRAACDECRKRKLKCSGEPAGCARCVKQNLMCHYSQQKQMGRPRKRQKVSGLDEQSERILSDPQPQPSLRQNSPGAPDQAIRGKDRYAVPYPSVVAQYIKTHHPPPQPALPADDGYGYLNGYANNSDSDATPPNNSPPTPYLSYPTSMEAWPDYSTMTQLPSMVTAKHKTPSEASASATGSSFESLNTLPSIPACPCLPNLYLTLSTLATVARFPVSNHTVESLITATRTAHSVLYCKVCPQEFQSGMQNVMLLGTLLTVLADGWNRVRTAPVAELRKGFSAARPSSTEHEIPLTPQEALCWRLFAHVMVRAHVFGDAVAPTPFKLPDGSMSHSNCPFQCPKGIPVTLSFLISAMDRRQKTWHEMQVATGEFCSRMPHTDFERQLAEKQHSDSEFEHQGHLCLSIVSGAALTVRALDQPAPTCADLGLSDHVHRDECHICDSVVGQGYTDAISSQRSSDVLDNIKV